MYTFTLTHCLAYTYIYRTFKVCKCFGLHVHPCIHTHPYLYVPHTYMYTPHTSTLIHTPTCTLYTPILPTLHLHLHTILYQRVGPLQRWPQH